MRARSTFTTLVIAVMSSALVAGCGSDSSEEGAQDNPYDLITPGVLLAATSGDQPPFSVVEGGDDPAGFTIDLNNEVAKRLGLTTEYRLTDTSSGIQGLSAEQYDVVANGLGVTPEREESILFAKGEYWSTTAALTEKASTVATMDDLSGLRVGVVTGTVQVGYLENIEGAVAVEFASQNAATSALTSGSIDAFLVGGPDAEEYLKQFPELEIAASSPVDHATTVAFQHDNSALKSAYDEQLQAMVDDGTYMEIYSSYFQEAPQPQLLDIWPGLA